MINVLVAVALNIKSVVGMKLKKLLELNYVWPVGRIPAGLIFCLFSAFTGIISSKGA